jgi:hypothetical protein
MVNPYESPRSESTAATSQVILSNKFLTQKWFLTILSLIGSWPLFLFWYAGFSVIVGWQEPRGFGDMFAWPITILMSYLIFLWGWYVYAFIFSRGIRYAKGLSILYSCICALFFMSLFSILAEHFGIMKRRPDIPPMTDEQSQFIIMLVLVICMYYGFIALGHWSVYRYYQRLTKPVHDFNNSR